MDRQAGRQARVREEYKEEEKRAELAGVNFPGA